MMLKKLPVEVQSGSTDPLVTYNITATSGTEVSGSTDPLATYNITATSGTEASGSSDQTFNDIEETAGGSTVSGSSDQTFNDVEETNGGLNVSVNSAYVAVDYLITANGGVIASGQTKSIYNLISSGGALISGTYTFAFEFESEDAEINFASASTFLIGYKWIPANRRNRIYIRGDASVITNNYKFISTGGISIKSENIYQLSYYDDPCPTTNGFSYITKYPNKHIECAYEEIYYTECLVLNRNYKCQISSKAVLSAITTARQNGYLPPKKRKNGIQKIR